MILNRLRCLVGKHKWYPFYMNGWPSSVDPGWTGSTKSVPLSRDCMNCGATSTGIFHICELNGAYKLNQLLCKLLNGWIPDIEKGETLSGDEE